MKRTARFAATLQLAAWCLIAGLAGWWGMESWQGRNSHEDKNGRRPTHPASPSHTSHAPQPTAVGCAALAQWAAGFSGLSDSEVAAARERIAILPPGTARSLAEALLNARLDYASDPFNDPFGPPAPDAKREPGTYATLAAELLDAANTSDSFAGGGLDSRFREWVALDPAAASAVVLKMPPGKLRAAALDAAAEVMAGSDPAAAWVMVVKSGERSLGPGAARAWVELSSQNAGKTGAATPVSPTRAQSAYLCAALASLVKGSYGDSPGSTTMLSDALLVPLSNTLGSLPSSPAKMQLVAAITGRNAMLGILTPDSNPEKAAAWAQLLLQGAAASPAETVEMLIDPAKLALHPEFSPAVLNVAAPLLLPQLASAGHVEEAAQLLPRVLDPEARRIALEGILPQWMDADPAAARAAFLAAPFTALERERWLRHPAFLLNP